MRCRIDRWGTGLSLEELAMPDLDLIKQGEHAAGPAQALLAARTCVRRGHRLLEDPATCGCPVYDGPAAPAPGLQRDLLFSSSPGAGCTSHLNVPEH